MTAVVQLKLKVSRTAQMVNHLSCSFPTRTEQPPDKITAGKAQKITIKLSWEISTIYSGELQLPILISFGEFIQELN
jgi:hypothetical protein